MAVDLARLNLAAVLYRSDTGSWPTRVSDVVPSYVKLQSGSHATTVQSPGTGSAGPRSTVVFDPVQLYVWSPELEVFVPKESYNPFVMVGII